MKRTQVRFQWQGEPVQDEFRTAVSLHSHTMHSQESLSFIPRCAAAVPILDWELRRQARKYQARTGRVLDYTRGHWTPPLPGREAYLVEKQHIEEKLDLAALVSLSDHDDIEAGCQLRVMEDTKDAPISMEWTVPTGQTYFHIGVHNLPPNQARGIAKDLSRYAGDHSPALLKELLEGLNRYPEVLVVLNHPFWDQGEIGAEKHRALLVDLLDTANGCVHALELNGLRPWQENQELTKLAGERNYMLVSGGDRHGCEPSSMINLTGASSFDEFVAEVRGGTSHVIVLDHYREPRAFRILKSVCDIMGYYPELPGRSRWSDRVYCKLFSGKLAPLSQVWKGELPRVIHFFDHAIQFTRKRGVRQVLRFCFAGKDAYPSLEPDEIAGKPISALLP